MENASIPTSDGVYFVEGKDIVTVKGSNDEMAIVRVQGTCKLDRDSSSKVVCGSNFYHSFFNYRTIIIL